MTTVFCPYCASEVLDDGTLSGTEVLCPRCMGRFQMPTAPVVFRACKRDRKYGGGAALASFLFPGAGQVMCGRFASALLVMVGFWCTFAIGVAGLYPALLVSFLLWFWGVIDAYHSGSKVR